MFLITVKIKSNRVSSLGLHSMQVEPQQLQTFHASECARQGIDKVILRTVDTDVVGFAISNFLSLGISEMWIAFGVEKQYGYIATHDIVRALGDFPRIHRVRSDVCILRTREEHSVGDMDVLWKSHFSFHSP